MEDLSKLSNNPRVEELNKLISQKDSLEQVIAKSEFVTDDIRDAYVQSHANVALKLDTVAAEEPVRDELTRIHAEASTSLDQIQQLEEITGEENPLKQEFQERVEIIAPLLGKEATKQEVDLSETLQTIPASGKAETSPAAAEEAEAVKRCVQLTVSQKMVSVGRSGKKVSFAPTRGNPENYKTYRDARRTALKYVISRQGEQIKPDEVLEAIEKEVEIDESLRHDTLRSVRSFFEQLTHRRSQIVLHNGVRGAGSRYYTSESFDLTLVERDSKPVEAEAATDIVEASEAMQDQPSESAEKAANEDLISTHNLALVAHRLRRIKKALLDYDFPAVEEDLVDELIEAAKSMHQDITKDTYGIEEKREKAALSLKELINDDAKIFEYMDLTEEVSPQYRFIEYFVDLENVDDKDLMQRLISSEIRTRYDSGKDGMVAETTYYLSDKETKEVLWPLSAEAGGEYGANKKGHSDDDDFAVVVKSQEPESDEFEVSLKGAETEEDEEVESTLQEQPELDPDTTTQLGINPLPEEEPQGQVYLDASKNPQPERRNTEKQAVREKFDEIKEDLAKCATQFKDHLGSNTSKSKGVTYQVLVSSGIVTPRIIGEALAADSVLSGNEHDARNRTYTVEDMLRVRAYQLTKDTRFSIQQKKTSKHVVRVIDELVETFPG